MSVAISSQSTLLVISGVPPVTLDALLRDTIRNHPAAIRISRLQELKKRTEVMPSMAARGYWKLEVIDCQGASWSEQLDGKELREALGSAIGTKRIAFPGHRPLILLHLLQCGMLISKVCISPVVPLLRRKVVPRIGPSFSHVLCVRALGYPRVAFPALEAGVACSVRAVFENSYICGSCLFGEGFRSAASV